MAVKQSRILKNDSITIEGTHKISHRGNNFAAGGVPSGGGGEPRAEIIQKEPGFAIIEVTCGCGQKIQLRCDYTPSQNNQSENEQGG